MSKMAEMDMMVQEVVELVEQNGLYLTEAMPMVSERWALDSEEYQMVYTEANYRIYH